MSMAVVWEAEGAMTMNKRQQKIIALTGRLTEGSISTMTNGILLPISYSKRAGAGRARCLSSWTHAGVSTNANEAAPLV